jgi:two-component system, cell cycle sensor histidine kinase and response regulator CckA
VTCAACHWSATLVRSPRNRLRARDIAHFVVEHVLDLVTALDDEGHVVFASPSHERVLGYTPEELIGRSPLELVHPSDREVARAALMAADGRPASTRLRHRDGHWVVVEGTISAVPDAGDAAVRCVAVSRDVTTRVRADRLREAQYRVTRALSAAGTVEEGSVAVLRVIAEQLGWRMGVLWQVDPDAEALRCVALWKPASAASDQFEELTRRITFVRGEGLPGRVWETGDPAWIADVAADHALPRRDAAERAGVHAGVAVRVDCGESPWGVMEFFSGDAREPEADILAVLATIGTQLGQFIERMDAQHAVRDQELRKRAVVDAALDCVVTMDHRGRILEFNPAAERTFGYSAAEVVGRELAEVLVPPSLRDRHRAGLARYVETGRSTIIGRRLEMPALAADGREFPVELAIVRVDLPGPPLFSGYIRDITERLRAEEALRESRSLLQAVADGTPDALFLKDREGTYLLINEAGARALGHTVEEVIGARDADLMPAEAAAELEETDRRVMESGQTRVSEDRVGERTFLATKAPYRAEDGEVVGVLGVAHDITERRRLEEELQHAHKMEAVGRLAGGVAHDFNNVLTVIRGFSDLAREQLAVGGDIAGSLHEVTRATERGTALTQPLLSLSRRAPVVTEPVDLNAVVADMDTLLRRVIGEDLRLVTVFGASPGVVRANRSQLEQVILNLAINARDAMPSGGKLTIETADASVDAEAADELGVVPGPHVMLRVCDTGAGMDAETRARVFEPFFTTKPAGHGTGLGLATVHGVVSQSGGHIAVRSSPDAGTTFVIHLPAAAAKPAAAEAPAAAPAEPQPSGTILVAEDEPALRSLFATTLREYASAVLTAHSGEEALAIAAAHAGDVDVLITDVIMPGMRGTELAARLRERNPRLRVIFATGYSDQPLGPHLRWGDTVLTKPFTIRELVHAVAQARGPAGQDTRSSA